MRIVLAASIYPPEIGGPAPYAAELKDALERQGHSAPVLVFSSYRRIPSGLRHLWYTWRLFRMSRGADAIIAFDTMTVGLPAALVRVLRGIPVIARVGGDFIWERYVERTHDLVPLPQFYATRSRWNIKDRILFIIQSFVVGRVLVAFSSSWQREIWKTPYRIDNAHSTIIENAIPPKQEAIPPLKKNFLFYGRLIALKNGALLQRASEMAREQYPDIEVETGIVPHEEFIEKIRSCYAVVLPSISDITPNTIIDAIRCGKPFLLTTYSAYAEKFRDFGVIVNPLDEHDIARGIESLCAPETYAKLCERIAAFDTVRTYDDIARDFVHAIEKI